MASFVGERRRNGALGTGRRAAASLVGFSLPFVVYPVVIFGQEVDDMGPDGGAERLAADSAVAHSEAREERPLLGVGETELIGQLTGEGSLNDTASRWDVHGADLGHMFWHRDQLYMVFGDTFGKGGLGGKNWRSNTLARLAKPNPKEGLLIESMIAGPDGNAKELIPSRKIDGVEKTVIPTYGISIEDRMYLHYMSVVKWGGGNGKWEVRHSGIAYSDDDGQTWTVPESAIWPASTGFEQVALVHGEKYVYMLGIPGGRYGGVRLSRVAPDGLLDRRTYEYWDGQGWVSDVEKATIIVPAPVGELSVAWNEQHQRWVMLYLNAARRAVMLRTAPELTGPWGDEQVVVNAKQYRGLYAPYIVPLEKLGDEVYFTLSLWKPYNVFLMRLKLKKQGGSVVVEEAQQAT